MDPAHHCRRLSSAQIAASTSLGLLLVVGREGVSRLYGPRFQVHAGGAGQRPEGEGTDSSPGDRVVLALGQSGSQKNKAEDHQQAAYDDHESA